MAQPLTFADLQSTDVEKFNAAWKEFFLNEMLVARFLAETSVELVHTTLAAGHSWSGAGWNTTRASKEMHRLSKVALVASEITEYSHTFLFSLALVCGVEVQQLELSERGGQAAFALAERWSTYVEAKTADENMKDEKIRAANHSATTGEEEEGSEEEDEGVKLPWEEEAEELPDSLKACLQAVNAGQRLPWKAVLSGIPLYSQLKHRAEDNNHGGDAKAPVDRLLKSYQQKCLNVARMVACLQKGIQAPEYAVLGQQLFYAVLELEQGIMKERKRRSIPGAVPQTANGLFSKEDLAIEKSQRDINVAGIESVLSKDPRRQCRFPTNTGAKFTRWKPAPLFRGKGKAGGYGSQWNQPWKPRFRHMDSNAQKPHVLFSPSVTVPRGQGNGPGEEATKAEACRAVRHGKASPVDQCSIKALCSSKPAASLCNDIEPLNSEIGKVDNFGKASFPAFGLDHAERVTVGGDSHGGEAENVPSMVEEHCTPIHSTITSTGGGDRPTPPSNDVGPGAEKRGQGKFSGHKNSGRVQHMWGCKEGSRHPKHKALGAMVCADKRGGRRPKTSPHCRLQGAKSVLLPRKVHPGKHVHNFSPAPKRVVQCETGFERCIFSSTIEKGDASVCTNVGGRRAVGVSKCPIWAKHSAQNFHVGNEAPPETVEVKGTHGIRLFGRHHIVWFHKKFSPKTIKFPLGNVDHSRFQDQPEKIHSQSDPAHSASGFPNKLGKGAAGGSKSKTEDHSQRIGQGNGGRKNDLPKNVKHFGPNQKPVGGPAISAVGHPKITSVFSNGCRQGVGPLGVHPPGIKSRDSQFKKFSATRLGPTIFGKGVQSTPQRQFDLGMGGDGHLPRRDRQGLLEGGPCPPHKHEGVKSSSGHNKKFCSARGDCPTKCGQSGRPVLPEKVGGEEGVPEQNFGAPFSLVLGAQNSVGSAVGALGKNVGRPSHKGGAGQGGLHPKPKNFQRHRGFFQGKDLSPGGHVLHPLKCKVPPLLHQVPPPRGSSGGCPELQFGGVGGGVCKPPMEGNFALAGTAQKTQKRDMPSHHPYVGFKCMVAPINKNVTATHAHVGHSSQGRDVCQLLERINASSKVAPGLHHCLRFILEQQQVQNKEILLAVKSLGDVSRYDRGFKKLYVLLQDMGVTPLQARSVDIATALMSLQELSPSEARNAYAGVCLLPGFEAVRFSPLIKKLKTSWGRGVQKYATFWDAQPILNKLRCNTPPGTCRCQN